MYAIGLAGRRRDEPPRDDLLSLMLAAEVDGTPMTDIEFGSFFVQLVTAGQRHDEDDALVGRARAARAPGSARPRCGPIPR